MIRTSQVLFLASCLACLALFGCGGAGAQDDSPESAQAAIFAYSEPSPELSQILEKLAEAAEEERTYMAVRKARDLGPVEKSMTHWLCETAWQLVVNDELDLLPDRKYLADRLTIRVILEMTGDYSPENQARYRVPIGIAVDEVDRVFDGPQSKLYKRACYGANG
jgi:hypothetical protein